MIKDKILQIINNKQKLYSSKFSFRELCEIFNKTTFLKPNAKLSERCYCICNNILSPKVCLNCGNKVKFLRWCNGYRKFCSCTCKNQYLLEHTNIAERISCTLKIYHNNLSKIERRKQQDKRLNTMTKLKLIAPKELKKDKELYYSEVRKVTNSQNLSSLKNYDKRGKGYELDHKYSIIKGFINNIPPFVIGNIVNLEMIPSHINASKKEKCSLTLDELINLFSSKLRDYPL